MSDIATIHESGLVDQATVEAFLADFSQVRHTKQIFRTRTEMVLSVLNDGKHPTPDAKYWQATREAGIQYNELVMLSYAYRRKALEVERLEKAVGQWWRLNRRELRVDLDEARYILSEQKLVAEDRLREIQEWTALRMELAEQCSYSLDDVDAHQMESLPKRFGNQMNTLGDADGAADRFNIISLHRTAQRVMEAQAQLTDGTR